MVSLKLRIASPIYDSPFTIYQPLDFVDLLPAQPCQLHWVFHPEQRVESRAHHIVWISRSEHFGAHVMDTDRMHYGPNCTSCNYSGPLRSRLNQNPARPEFS